MFRPPPASLLAVIWLVGAVLATATGLLAVRVVANQVGDEGVPTLTAGDIVRALPPQSSPPVSGPTARPAPPTPATGSAAPEPVSAPATFTAPGGVIAAQCRAQTPSLLYATPAQGYALEETELDEGQLSVRFEGDGVRSRVKIGCSGGAAVLLEHTD